MKKMDMLEILFLFLGYAVECKDTSVIKETDCCVSRRQRLVLVSPVFQQSVLRDLVVGHGFPE